MILAPEQVRVAAYHRWQRRGGAHGLDWSDWFAAEQELLFARNYEILASYRLDEDPPRFLGDAADPVCRFCEQSAPRASFTGAAPALPECLGNTSLWTFEECDVCRALFRESVEDDLDAFVRASRSGPSSLVRPGSHPESRPSSRSPPTRAWSRRRWRSSPGASWPTLRTRSSGSATPTTNSTAARSVISSAP